MENKAVELRYKFRRLSEEYSDWYMFRELLLYLNENQLEECYKEFIRIHPQSYYDAEGVQNDEI